MKHQLERDIQRTLLDWLRVWGAVPVRINSGATKVGKRFIKFNDEPGCSDLLVCLPDGMFAAVEVKRPGGKVTPKQRAFLALITKRNGIGLVVRSLDELKTALRAEGYDTETLNEPDPPRPAPAPARGRRPAGGRPRLPGPVVRRLG